MFAAGANCVYPHFHRLQAGGKHDEWNVGKRFLSVCKSIETSGLGPGLNNDREQYFYTVPQVLPILLAPFPATEKFNLILGVSGAIFLVPKSAVSCMLQNERELINQAAWTET